MSHRSGKTFRRTSARDRTLLVLGIALVLAALALSTCETSGDLLGGSEFASAAPLGSGGELA